MYYQLTALNSEYPGIGFVSKGGDLTIQPSQSTSDPGSGSIS